MELSLKNHAVDCIYLTSQIENMILSITQQNYLLTVNSIGLVKPEKAENLKKMIISMAQSGQIGGKVSFNHRLINNINQIFKQDSSI